MVALRIDALTSVALGMLKPLPPPTPATSRADSALAGTQALTQGLAQTLLQQTLQSVATPSSDLSSLMSGANLEASAALLASMKPGPTPTPSPASATPTVPTATAPGGVDEALGQEALIQNATRFGSGVGAPGSAVALEPRSTATPIRDASVVRLDGLQAEGSRPGPEAFPQPRAALAETLLAYQAAATEARQVDLSV